MRLINKHNLEKYLNGSGLEIGALDNPLNIRQETVDVHYVDIDCLDSLISQNPEIDAGKIIKPDIIAEAEDLSPIKTNSVGFVIACHILEHTPNPIKALIEMCRVLKPGGILYLSIPDKRYTFDMERPVTPLSHMIKDFKENVTLDSCQEHFQEWVDVVESARKRPTAITVEEAKQYRIHFHVWIPDSLLEMFGYIGQNHPTRFLLIDYYYRKGDMEVVYILQKTDMSGVNMPLKLKERYSLTRMILNKIYGLIGIVPRMISTDKQNSEKKL